MSLTTLLVKMREVSINTRASTIAEIVFATREISTYRRQQFKLRAKRIENMFWSISNHYYYNHIFTNGEDYAKGLQNIIDDTMKLLREL